MYTALASVCIMLLYIAYLMVTSPLLLRRFRGWPAIGAPEARRLPVRTCSASDAGRSR
jgi:hypothetical protein